MVKFYNAIFLLLYRRTYYSNYMKLIITFLLAHEIYEATLKYSECPLIWKAITHHGKNGAAEAHHH